MSIRNILPGGQADKDPYFKNVSLLLSGDSSTNGGQNNTFLDSSSNNFTITRNGNVTQGSFSPFGDRWSNYFNGSTDYLSVPSNANFAFGTGDFTIEFWAMPLIGETWMSICSTRPSVITESISWAVGVNSSGQPYFYSSGHFFNLSVNTIPKSTWTHIAITRSSASMKLFVNGTLSATVTNSENYTRNILSVGSNNNGSEFWAGNISNLRIIKGTALYTSTFSPPTSPLTAVSGTVLLTCQSNRFIDNSTYANAITVNGTPSVQKFSPFSPVSEYNASVDGGSAYFDGSGDWLNIPYHVNLNINSGNFTIECYFYPTQTGTNCLIAQWTNQNNLQECFTFRSINNNLNFCWKPYSNQNDMLIGGTVVKNSWNHCAVTRNGDVFTLWLNGASVATYTMPGSGTQNADTQIGTWFSGSSPQMSGYLHGCRIIKGTALYTSTFIPPTTPLTKETNTQLLCNFTNGNIIDSSLNNDLETVGNAQISTSVKKYGTGSMYFDGNGDYLTIPYTNNFNFPGDFTIEVYVNLISSLSSHPCIFGNYGTWGTNGSLAIFANDTSSSTTLTKYAVALNGVYPAIASINAITYNVWTHIALVRSGSTITLYVDGVSNGTYTSSVVIAGTLDKWWFGVSGDSGSSINGYIDDLRITKGIARYTANFTPPTAPLPKQ